jgi:DNA-binding CsgD family transcriptional regulator
VRRLRQVADPPDLLAEISAQLRRLVPFAAGAWVATDPSSGLPTLPTRFEGLDDTDPADVAAHWSREFLVDDVNLFRDLARSAVPAGSLRAATDDPMTSTRYREWVGPNGYGDELRAVLRVGDRPWAVMALLRRADEQPFSVREVELVASLSAPVGEALRVRARPTAPTGERVPDSPGFLLFAPDGDLVSVDDAARHWLSEVAADKLVPTDLALDVPMWMMATVFRALAANRGLGDGTARARIRSRRGRWLVCHASRLAGPDGAPAHVAVVVEPATATEMASIVVAAYGLTEREQQVTALLARGAATSEIAAELFLSGHTVRDHIKAIFQKVDVSSRGELVAKVFTDHPWPADRDLPTVTDQVDAGVARRNSTP